MSENQLKFYRGDLDGQVSNAPNGAKANASYLADMASGPWAEIKTWRVNERCFTISGIALPNHTFVEGDTGLILIDPGMNFGNGQQALELAREFSDKPVAAIIYSHNHYTAGAQAILDAFPDRDIPIYGHPDIEKNMAELTAGIGGGIRRRGMSMLGVMLPREGEDAAIVHRFFPPVYPANPALMRSGHVPASYHVRDGEALTIDGVKVSFYHTHADTNDSLIMHFPELDLVVHNAAMMPVMFPLYTLRGDFYRHPMRLLEGLDRIRKIDPTYLVGCHGFPETDRQSAYDLVTVNRDFIAFVYQQTIRGINAGRTPDQIVEAFELPPYLSDHPSLSQSYIDVEYAIRGVYRGMIGWWAEDTAELHPPSDEEFYGVLLEQPGGPGRVHKRAQDAFAEGKYNLVAKLMSAILSAHPDFSAAKTLKAEALRKMAQASPSGIQTRNFMLTEALHLEGKIDRMRLPGPPPGSPVDLSVVLRRAPGTFLKVLEISADPSLADDLFASAHIRFVDLDLSYGLHVRAGAVEIDNEAPDVPSMTIEFERSVWAKIILRAETLSGAVESGEARLSIHDPETASRLHSVFAGAWGRP